ncbi:MAG: YciI family protein [Kangiellaceae bacterium]|nr:YciI family protein [Kangiellaceae bacterium]
MKYLLTIYEDEKVWDTVSEQDGEQIIGRYMQLVENLREQGVFVAAERLLPVDSATSVRVRDGQKLVTDGPFAETKEQLGGFFLVDCKDLDHAIDVASRIPGSETGTIEVRPLWYQD